MLICGLPLIWFCQHQEEVYCALCGSQLAFHMDISEGRGEILLYFGNIIFSTHPFWFTGHRKQAKRLVQGRMFTTHSASKVFSSILPSVIPPYWILHSMDASLEATWMWVNIWHGVRREKQSMKTLEGVLRSASPSVPEY